MNVLSYLYGVDAMSDQRIAIVGAGQAAAQAVETLRKRGHPGPITLIGDEACCPINARRCRRSIWPDHSIATGCCSGTRPTTRSMASTCGWVFAAVSIDRPRRRVEIADGSAVEYDALLLATGSHPRLLPLPGAELAGVHYLRTVADVDRLRAELQPGPARGHHRRRLYRPRSRRHLPRSGPRRDRARGRRPRDESGGSARGLARSMRPSMRGMA